MVQLAHMQTVSARELQRGYKKVLEKANKIKEPLVVMSNNQPKGAIISLDILEKLRLDAVVEEALQEYREGKTKSISTPEELEAEFEEIRKIAREK